jgi:glycosyltransferase involved in cell wall biosynthesis
MVPVSVVIPCFRCANTISAAVESVRKQTAEALEVIAVDDASEGDTPRELSELPRRYGKEWLKVIRLPRNVGPASARNTGWNAAIGEFVAFLDADDTWHPRKLEIQYGVMRADPGIALCSHSHVIGDTAQVPVSARPAISEISPRSLLWRNRFTPSSVMVKRDLQGRFPDGQRCMEDHRAWLEFAFSGQRIVMIDLPLAEQHKPAYGASGQSADLIAMERAELENYRQLWREGHINGLLLAVLWIWSLAKFARRVVVVALRRISRPA